MKKMCILIMLAIGACILSTQAGIIYSENFESCTNGQTVTEAPLNWTTKSGLDQHVTSGTSLNGLAIDGDNNNDNATWYNSGMHVAYVSIKSPTSITETYSLNYICEVFEGGGYTTTYGGSFGFCDSNGVGLATAYYNQSSKSWNFDTRGLDGKLNRMPTSGGYNEVLNITITIDMVNNQAMLNIAGGTYSATDTHSISTNSVFKIAGLMIYQDMRPYSGGLDVDDIIVTETPVFATIGLIFTGIAGMLIAGKND